MPALLLFLILAANEPPTPKDEDIAPVLAKALGEPVRIETGLTSHTFMGDFNGDRRPDLAVFVDLPPLKAKLKARGVHFVDVDPWSKTNGKEVDPEQGITSSCVGVVILHAGKQGWHEPEALYAFYDCMSGMKVEPRGKKKKARGDSLLLDLESGAVVRVSWDGKTYRGATVRGGD